MITFLTGVGAFVAGFALGMMAFVLWVVVDARLCARAARRRAVFRAATRVDV
jgi:hypothetical protein